MASTLNAALFYSQELGWPIIPVWPVDRMGETIRCRCGNPNCTRQGKHPINFYAKINPVVPHGIADATTDERKIRRWWSFISDASIGVRAEKFFALDVDEEEAYRQLVEGFGRLPDTVESISGSGGRHILFKQPEGIVLGNHEGNLPNGINVRSGMAYIIVPPSMHKSGKRYEWEVSSHPRDVELAEAPDWLIKLITAGQLEGVDVNITDVEPPLFETLQIPDYIKQLIINGSKPGDDRSRDDMTVACFLVEASCDESEIAAIFRQHKIGTEGKYSERGEDYLYRTIGMAMAKTKPKWGKRPVPSKIQPNTYVTEEEAKHEETALNLAYLQGWNDALSGNPSVVPALWPEYVGLTKDAIKFYSIGLQLDYKIDDGENEYPALVVPYHDMGTVTTLDYSLAKVPEDTPHRIWQCESGIQYFDSERFRSAPITGKAIVTEDFDTAMHLFFGTEYGVAMNDYAVIGQPASGASSARLQALASLLADSEQVWLAWPASRLAEGKVLAKMLERGWERVMWISLPFPMRDMVSKYRMKPEQLMRGINISTPVATR